VLYGDGTQAYDFVSVMDCARANVCAMQADTTDRFYNVGTGVKTTIDEVARLLLELTDSDLEVEYQPGGLTFVKNRIGSPDRARDEIGFVAQTPLREGLQELIEWRASHKAEVERRRQDVGLTL
jgi:UDP-glucose 4-epimerase